MRDVTTPETPARSDRSGVLLEVLGLLLLLLGAGMIVNAAVLVDPRLGLALAGAILVVAGYRLASSDSEE